MPPEIEETHIDPVGPVAGSDEVTDAEYEAWQKGEELEAGGDQPAQAEETQPAEGAATEGQGEEGGGEQTAEVSTAEGEGEPETPKKDQPPEWVRKRLGALSAQRNAEAQARAEAEAKLAAAQALLAAQGLQTEEQNESAAPKDRVYTQAELDAEATKRAESIAAANAFNNQCNSLFEQGAKAYGEAEFDANLQNLRDVGVISPDDLGFVRDALETEAPEKVLFHLGQNPDEALKIASLSPTKRAVALDRLAVQLSTEKPKPSKPVSKVPAPIAPVGSGRSTKEIDISDPNISDEDFFREMERLDRQRATG